jgi:hypothetical protein
MRHTILFLLLLIIPAQLFSQTVKILPNTFFKDGESLKFDLKYGFIVGGSIELKISQSTGERGVMNHLTGTAVTVGLADKIYAVRDIYESYFPDDSGLPVFAIRNIKENKYKYYEEVRFNRLNNTVNSSKSGEHVVPEGILDMASVLYYIRRFDWSLIKENEVIKFNTYFGDEVFPFMVIYRGKETITTDFGKIRCLKFAPIVEPGRVFKKKDDMVIWYSDDENRIPVRISMGMVVGHVIAELNKFSNLLTPPKFEKKK